MQNRVVFYEDKELETRLIGETFKEAYGAEYNENNWNWRFKNNPFSDQIKIAYVMSGGILASYYAVSPTEITINGNRYKSALSLMTMTHPKFKGKGLFKDLTSKMINHLRDDGFSLIYGFANSNSHYGFRKYLGWRDLMPMYNLKGNKLPIVEIVGSVVEGNVNLRVLEVLSKMDFSLGKICLARDYKYLRHRFYQNPMYQYRFMYIEQNGVIKIGLIYKIYKGSLDIMEIFHEKGSNNHEFLIQLLCKLFNQFKKPINIWSNIYNSEHLILEKLAFKPNLFNSYFGYIPLTELDSIDQFKNWHIRFIDSDIF